MAKTLPWGDGLEGWVLCIGSTRWVVGVNGIGVWEESFFSGAVEEIFFSASPEPCSATAWPKLLPTSAYTPT